MGNNESSEADSAEALTPSAINLTDYANSSCTRLKLERFDFDSTLLLGFIMPFAILFGLVANTLNFRIFTHKFMISSLLNWYLAILALSDIVVLLTGFFFLSLPRLGEYYDNFALVNFSNQASVVSYPAGLMAQTASVWLTVLMSTHRFIGVCLPFKMTRICTKSNCKMALAAVLAFAVLINVPRWFEVKTEQCYLAEFNVMLSEPKTTEFRQSPLYQTIYIVWCYFLIMFCVPFVLLITLNTAVILAIRRTTRLHYQVALAATPSSNERSSMVLHDRFKHRASSVFRKRGEASKEVSTSIMLVGVVVAFLVCNTLAFVINAIERFADDAHQRKTYYHRMVDVSNFLVMLNGGINLFVYLSFSEKFRLLLKHYLTFGCFNHSEPLIDTTMTKI